MSETTRTYTDTELRYAATARCECGSGLAYPKDTDLHGAWDCADILTGRAIPSGEPGAKQHTARLPFAFYEIKSEEQPSANGATTRPPESAAQRERRLDDDARRQLEALISIAEAKRAAFLHDNEAAWCCLIGLAHDGIVSQPEFVALGKRLFVQTQGATPPQ